MTTMAGLRLPSRVQLHYISSAGVSIHNDIPGRRRRLRPRLLQMASASGSRSGCTLDTVAPTVLPAVDDPPQERRHPRYTGFGSRRTSVLGRMYVQL